MTYRICNMEGKNLDELRKESGRSVPWITKKIGSNVDNVTYWYRNSRFPHNVNALEFILREYGDMVLYSDKGETEATIRLSLEEKEGK